MQYNHGVVGTASTRTESVYETLRTELLNCQLAPGSKLKMMDLAERFSASLSVVREVLTRLAEQGLVVATPQRGFRVRDLSIEDIAQLTEARVEIEAVALRLAIQRGDIHWETSVLSTHHLLERTPVAHADGSFNEEWPVRHRDFHSALLSGCANRRIDDVAEALRDGAELYRRWYWALTDDHHRDLAGEHLRLRDLALARDADAAVSLLSDHIQRAPLQLIEYAREHGEDALDRPAAPRQARTYTRSAGA